MRPEERYQQILQVLDEEDFVTVKTLSKRFYVSYPTVYRDLREMENQGLVIRGNGGAVRVAEEKANLPLDFRKTVQAQEKAKIAQKATELIRPHATIFLDASTTAAGMAEYLDPGMGITVLTNGLMTAVRLKETGIRTFCVGGSLIGNSVAVVGKLTDDFLEHFSIDMLFFSALGVDERGLIIDSSEQESFLRRRLLQKPLTSVFLCDSRTFGKRSVFRLASLDMIDYVVTDAPLPEHYPQPRKGLLTVF